MANKLTTLLLIALMLVLPLRAMAGLAMACPMASDAAMQMPHEGSAEMPSGHCQHEQGDSDQQHAQGGCKLCADCCMASFSLPVSIQFGLAANPQSILIPLFIQAYTGFQPEGPERPPRSSAF